MGRARRRGWREPGGIAALVELIDAHRGAIEYDWRVRFHLPLSVVGESMTYGEAFRLLQVLLRDTSAAITAAVAGWESPVSQESLLLMDLFDLRHSIAISKKAPPHPGRPQPKRGTVAGRPATEVLAILRPDKPPA